MIIKYYKVLKIHIQSKHNGEFYGCDKCEYKSCTNSILKNLIDFKHKGISYDCNECDYKANMQCHLQRHIIIFIAVTNVITKKKHCEVLENM